MPISNKNEIILIGDNDKIIELKGAELEAFLEQRKKDEEQHKLEKVQEEARKELKISAYKKLGLTDEEIQAII